MDKIVVRLNEGRSKGATLVVKRSATKCGATAVGKSNTYNAEAVDDGSSFEAPHDQQATGTASSQDESLVFELALGHQVPLENRGPTPEDTQPVSIQSIADALSGMEAKLLRSLDAMESRLTEMQAVIDELEIPRVHAASSREESLCELEVCPPVSAPVPVLNSTMEQQTPSQRPWTPSVLTDVSNRSSGVGAYCVPHEDVAHCVVSCRSRRNLARRLAMKIFSPQEKIGSNCRGVLGKRALNIVKVRAIFASCLQQFPLMEDLENNFMAEKEMRNAIDEICRKAKPVT